MEKSLHGFRRAFAFAGAHDGRGNAHRHFARKARTGQRGHAVRRRQLAQNAAHRLAGLVFDAFGDADKNSRMTFQFSPQRRGRIAMESPAPTLRVRRRLWQNPAPFSNPSAARRRATAFRCGPLQFGEQRGVDVPQHNMIAVFVQHFRQRRAPRAGAQNADFHFFPSEFLVGPASCLPGRLEASPTVFFPKRFSVPAMSRWMLDLCL